MHYLPETEYLVSTYGIEHALNKVLGQAPDFAEYDASKVFRTAPRDASEGAELIHTLTDHNLNYVAETNTWYCWNGTIHVPLRTTTVPDQLIDVLSDLLKEAESFIKAVEAAQVKEARDNLSGDKLKQTVAALQAAHAETIKHFKGFASSLATNKGVKDTREKLARIVARPAKYFEQDNQWLAVNNGVIDR